MSPRGKTVAVVRPRAGGGFAVRIATMLLAISAPAGAYTIDLAGEPLDVAGFVAGDVRLFPHEPELPRQETQVHFFSAVLQPELRHERASGRHRFTLIPFLRVDAEDDERTHFDLREANWLFVADDWDLRLGVGKVFWGVTESRHLVDVINQVDAVEDVDEEDRLGQPMVAFNWLSDQGTASFFYLPYARERTFPGARGRLRFPLLVDTERARYDSDLGEWTPSFAVRWSQYVGDVDYAVAHFWGVGREPRFRIRPGPGGVPTGLLPLYDRIHQTSVEGQYTSGSWLWKLETLTRSGQGDRFYAFVAGFEYTFFTVLGSNADLGVLGEYLYDERDENPTRTPPTPFEDDVFGGFRVALNDVQSTAVLAGAILDRDDQAVFGLVEASRRLYDSWLVEIEMRVLGNIPPDDILYGLRQDDHLQLRLAYYW